VKVHKKEGLQSSIGGNLGHAQSTKKGWGEKKDRRGEEVKHERSIWTPLQKNVR